MISTLQERSFTEWCFFASVESLPPCFVFTVFITFPHSKPCRLSGYFYEINGFEVWTKSASVLLTKDQCSSVFYRKWDEMWKSKMETPFTYCIIHWMMIMPHRFKNKHRVNRYIPRPEVFLKTWSVILNSIEEGFIQKRRQRSSLLFGWHNLFNSLLR